MMDYSLLFDRFMNLYFLSDDDRKELLTRIHEEVSAGLEILGNMAVNDVKKIVEPIPLDKKEDFLVAFATIATYAAYDGYNLYLITQNINPREVELTTSTRTSKLGSRFTEGYKKDQNKSIVDSIDPLLRLFLLKVYELRSNQLLSLFPSLVELPYKTTEKLNQMLLWTGHQGFVLGVLEGLLNKEK